MIRFLTKKGVGLMVIREECGWAFKIDNRMGTMRMSSLNRGGRSTSYRTWEIVSSDGRGKAMSTFDT